MFCVYCGKIVPDNSSFCPACGKKISRVPEIQAGSVMAPKKETNSSVNSLSKISLSQAWNISIIAAFCSLVFLGLPYLSVSMDLGYGLWNTGYSGYDLLYYIVFVAEDFKYYGTSDVTGIMVILLIIASISTIVTSIMGKRARISKRETLKTIIFCEAVLYCGSASVPILSVIMSGRSGVSIGIGCLLNLVVAGVMIVLFVTTFSKEFQTNP